MKVVVVNNLFPPNVIGGAERSVATLVRGLIDKGIDVTVLTLSTAKGDDLNVGGAKVRRIPLRNVYWPFANAEPNRMARAVWHVLDSYNPLMRPALDAALAAERADLLHTNNLAGFSVVAWDVARTRDIPIVHTLRDYYLTCVRSTRQRGQRMCRRTCVECSSASLPRRRASKAVTAVVGNSQHILDCHTDAGYFSMARHREVIHSAYDPGVQEWRKEARGRKGLRFGYLGRLHPTKGVEVLIDSFKRAEPLDAQLLIAGSGTLTYTAALRRRAAGGAIEFVGYVEPASFLNEVDVLVVPSIWGEPLPRAVYEAYAHGVGVLASNRGGTPEIVEEGYSGFVFEPTVERLTELIKRCASDPAIVRHIGEGGRSMASRFVPERSVALYVRVYERVLASC